MSGGSFTLFKSGGVDPEKNYYTHEVQINKFIEISNKLYSIYNKERNDEELSAANLSLLTYYVINYMEKWAGSMAKKHFNQKDSSVHSWPFTKLPIKLFHNYDANGSLFEILNFLFKEKYSLIKNNNTYFNYQFLNSLSDLRKHQKGQLTENELNEYNFFNRIFINLIEYLKNQKILKTFEIYFSSKLNEKRQKELSDIAMKHGANVTRELNQNIITHIIYPNSEEITTISSDDIRTIKVNNEKKEALIHWWCVPASYDTWVPDSVVEGNVPNDANGDYNDKKIWHLGERFITDLEEFNEWGVEFDYEIIDMTETEQESEHSKTSLKRKNRDFDNNLAKKDNNNDENLEQENSGNASSQQSSMLLPVPPPKKRQRVISNGKTKPKTMKLKLSLKRHSKHGKQDSELHGSIHEIGNELKSKEGNKEALLLGGDLFPYNGPQLTRISPSVPRFPIVIPTYSRWFRLDRIHAIEYQSLNDIFCNRSMEYHKRYMDIRNFIVNTWRMNPRIYLTVTACRKLLACDAGKLLKIHNFLQEWGLINYKIDDGSLPIWEPPMVEYTHVETPFGIKKLALKNKENPKNEENNNNNDNSNNNNKQISGNKEMFLMRENMFECAKNKIENLKNEKREKIVCCICGIDCSIARYRCLAEKSMIICSKCFDDENYPSIFDRNDFIGEFNNLNEEKNDLANRMNKMDKMDKMENDNKNESEEWSDELKNRLVIGLNKYHDNWDKVSDFVGKPKNECILQFLQLPIEDAYLERIENNGNNGNNNNNNNNMNDNYNNLPSMERSNISNAFTTNSKISPFADVWHPHLAHAASLAALVSDDIIKVASEAAFEYLKKQNESVSKNDNGNVENDINSNSSVNNWQKLGQNAIDVKAQAGGILGASTVIAKALNKRTDEHIQQMLQHLVLLQSQKVKAKLERLDQLWDLLQQERNELSQMKNELFRERIELSRQRMQVGMLNSSTINPHMETTNQ